MKQQCGHKAGVSIDDAEKTYLNTRSLVDLNFPVPSILRILSRAKDSIHSFKERP